MGYVYFGALFATMDAVCVLNNWEGHFQGWGDDLFNNNQLFLLALRIQREPCVSAKCFLPSARIYGHLLDPSATC